jgi:putative endopeptidase
MPGIIMKKIWIFCTALCAINFPINAQPNLEEQSLHLDWCDKTISPQENFYQFANGSWLQKNPIPPEYSRWNIFSVLEEQNINRIHDLLILAANNKHPVLGSAEQIVGDLYASSMDEKSIEALGAKPLKDEFKLIQAINNYTDLEDVIIHLHKIGVPALFSFIDMQDFKNSTQMIGALTQNGLTLPNRDYYLKNTPEFKKVRESLLVYIQNTMQLLGDNPEASKKAATIVLNIETMLAKSSMSQIQQRDPYAIYNPVNIKQLQNNYSNFAWDKYFTAMWQPNIQKINVAMPNFFRDLNQNLLKVSLEDWKIYLRWHLINEYAIYLPDPFVNESFRMSSALTGVKQLKPRWRRFIDHSNLAIEFAMGELYVKKYFSPQSKADVLSIMKNIRQALRDDLKTLSWMKPETREAAIKKLDLMAERVGYPDKWWDYSSLHVQRDTYVKNIMNANEFLLHHELQKIGKPIDRTEWAMSPQSVNAYYDPSMNNINIPAGILQPPFFDLNAPNSVNYGAIGWVIGHEITHGFDDEGSQFDGYGNLHNWWQPSDKKTFKKLTKCIVDQFSTYTIGNNIFVQGKLVAGEAIADLGGLKLAYHAFHNSQGYKIAKTIAGYTPDQQFFLSAAHLWASNIRQQQAINLITIDPHPPAINRVNGTLCNIPEFEITFKNLQKQVTQKKSYCKIW